MKKQFKRGLSLFMTVCMLLSCWVFFAPEADAVSSGSYSYELWIDSDNDTGGWNSASWTLTGTNNNGTGSTTTLGTSSQYVNMNNDHYTIISGTSTYFPTKLVFSWSFGGGLLTWRDMYVTIHISVNGTDLPLTITKNSSTGTYENSGQYIHSASASTTKGSGTVTCTVNSSAYPHANSVVFDLSPSNVTMPKTGSTTTSMRTHLTDQYGVIVSSSATGYSKTPTLTSNRSSITGVTCAAGTTTTSYDPWTITIANTAKLTTYDTNTISAKVSYTFNGYTVYNTKTFIITDPTYTFTFNVNGGTSISPSASVSKYYYNKLTSTVIPSSGVRPGYEFIAMYGSALAPNYDFTKPIPGTTAGYTDQLTTSTPVEGDKTWYAAWWATNVTATFVDNDGTVVGTVTGKFDKTLGEVSGEAVAAIEAPEYHKRPGDTGTYDYVFSGWVVDSAVDVNGNDYTGTIGGMSPDEAILQGDVTFRAAYSVKKNSYNVKFYDVNGNLTDADYSYNDLPTQPGDQTLAADNTYTYNFKGWTKVTDGTTDYYLVDQNGLTDDGTYIPITTDFTVRTDAVYVPVFEKIYKEYTVSFSYDGVDNKTVYNGLHYGDTYEVPVPQTSYTEGGYRYTYNGWTLNGNPAAPGTVKGNAAYVANYIQTFAVYTIRFFDYDGTQINYQQDQYNHGTQIDTTNINATPTYRDDNYEYTFKEFATTDGTAFASGTASADVDYYATYDKAALYTVNYYNGDELLETVKEVEGRAVPAYTGETPTKADDLYATNYEFASWLDNDGNEVTTMPAANVDLYAHYTADVINYSVKFLLDDGVTELIPEQTLHYGDTVTVPTEAERAKAPDNTYSYEFKSWDKDVSTVCVGDAVYTATYRKSYNYYTVKWLDENGDVFKQESYIYNERINAPLTQPETSQQPQNENYEMVFSAWQKDDGTFYKRGDRITGNATYTATYEEVGKTCNVTFLNDDGSIVQEIKVAYGTKLADIAVVTPIKTSTEDVHYNFNGWEGTDDDTIVTDKDTVYTATYIEEEHSFELDTVKTEPTFFEEGVGTEKCECGLTREVSIAKLTDIVPPTAKLYVKSATWETGDTADFTTAVPAAPSNNIIINTADSGDVNEIFNKDGSKGSGVATIQYSVQHGETDPVAIADAQWTTRFDYDATYEYLKNQAETEAGGDPIILKEKMAEVDAYMATLKANASGTLGNISTYADGKELVNDCEFVFYAKITDRLGNVSYVNSGLLVYDTTAPEVSVDSDNRYNSKHCIEATITASDNRAIDFVTLNGETIELDDNGKYTVTDAGLYQVIVTDTAGNETKVNFEVVGKHAIKTYIVAATCTEDGYQYDKCLLCQKEIGERITLPATGHDYNEGVYTKPTCETNGYTTYTCKKCGDKYVTEDDPATTGAHDWVLTQHADATCSATGYDTYTCSICSKTKTEIIDIDPDAHKYYYPVTVKATCTEDGSITRECKYCGYKDIETIPATGHTASGVWVVTQPATCLEEGLQVQYCANCDTTEVQASEVIPATGHSYKVKEVVAPTETEQGYTLYECVNCDESTEGHYKKDKYVDPTVMYTVTFVVEGVSTSIKKAEGETIIATEAPATVKAADETYKYTFSHWEDADGNTVTLPLEVTSETTLTAVFDSRYVNYAVTLVNENDDGTTTQIQKIGYLHNEQVVDLPEAPEKKSDEMYDYSYIGWKLKGSADDTASKTWTIAASDATLVPVYEATLREYTVVFAYDVDNVLQTLTVKAGEDAVYTGETPVKAYDTKYHYVFSGWSGSIENIQGPTYVTPKFTAVEHSKTAIKTTPADCVNPAITTYKCDTCGYEVTEETAPALGHIWGTPYVDENGNSVKECERCGEVIEDDTMYIVKFLNDDGSIVKTIGYLKYGTDISDKIPTASKAETASVSYEFIGWTPEVATTVTGNATYTATYKEIPKLFNVIYAIDSQNVLQVYKDIPGGSAVPAYTGAEPVKTETDDYGHYVFDGWSRNDETVTEDLYITAKFKKVEHVFTTTETEATCTEGAGITYTCDCGYHYTISTGKPLGHSWTIVETKEPTFDEDGYIIYECTRCHEQKEEILPEKDYIFVNITLTDQEGDPVQGATVSLYDNGVFVTSGVTDQNGKVTLVVEEAKDYTIVISGSGVDTVTSEITVNPDGTVDMSKVPTINVSKCSCTCHRDGLWPTIFRFFHKIIKMLVGDFKCCSDPDPRYYS